MRCRLKLSLARPSPAAAARPRSARGRLTLGVAGVWACAFAAANPLGCGSTQGTSFPDTGDGGGGGADSKAPQSDGGNPINFPDGQAFNDGGTPPPPPKCSAGASKYIYVVDDQNELYTFDPTKVPAATAFTDLGPLHCPGEPTPPSANSGVNSMAVDRQAIAWVNFNDGKLFKVDTTQKSLPCTATPFSAGSTGFTPQLGMGFATVSSTNVSETLYVSDNGGPGGACTSTKAGPGCSGLGLGSIVQSSMTLAPIGAYTGTAAGYNAELSGTGDGLLYGFFTTSPSVLGTINKSTGAVTNIIPLPTVNNSNGGYAFSFWGGDFWFYTAFPTAADPNATTSVTHLVAADGGISVPMKDIGFTIVGAGSSTCVPTVPPPNQ
jgi:hypothetical protein